MRNVLEGKVSAEALVARMTPPLFHRYSSPRMAPKVVIDNSVSDFYTVIEIYTHDCPGFLFRITQKLFGLGLNLWMARISTKVDQVVDVFYVQNLSGDKVEDEEKISKIKRQLLDELESL